MEALDFLAIGDIVVDDFIRLKEASVHCQINNENCEICMRWGDKIPFEFALRVAGVGNSANAAVCASRLGLKSALRGYVGDDDYGAECIRTLSTDRVDTTYIERVPNKHTNYHYVLWYESERTILIKHEVFEYKMPALPAAPRWLYLSSLANNSMPYHDAIIRQLSGWPDTKLAFQPGTFQIKAGAKALKHVYERTDFFCCNKSEAEIILGCTAGTDIKLLLTGIQTLGPKVVVITDDRRGAYALDEKGTAYYIPMYPDPRPPFERTGAGDAFASTIVSALALGVPLQEALLWGPINSMSVVQDVGAQKGLLTRGYLEGYIHAKPKDFALRSL